MFVLIAQLPTFFSSTFFCFKLLLKFLLPSFCFWCRFFHPSLIRSSATSNVCLQIIWTSPPCLCCYLQRVSVHTPTYMLSSTSTDRNGITNTSLFPTEWPIFLAHWLGFDIINLKRVAYLCIKKLTLQQVNTPRVNCEKKEIRGKVHPAKKSAGRVCAGQDRSSGGPTS